MGKGDFMSPKNIANRIKSKGLQKLRWYCQMCNKQCRDENGFKCHLTSESHKREMELFGQAPQKVIDEFTEEFESTFLEHLRRCHPFSRVSANVVYNEFIQDRQHVHMNSTKWLTLTEFVKHLGREGKCKVEDTPKGWFITLIQKDPFDELDEKKRKKRERDEMDEEERHRRMLEAQAERARQAAQTGNNGEPGEDEKGGEPAEYRPEDMEGPLKLSIGGGARSGGLGVVASRPAAVNRAAFDEGEENGRPAGRGSGSRPNAPAGPPTKKSKLEELMERDMRAKQQALASDAALAAGTKNTPIRPTWIAEGIIVKVMSRALREHGYYKQKGVVLQVIDNRVAEIEMLGSGDVIRVDQAELETVVPQPGGAVLVVNGPMRGCKGTLESINEASFKANILLVDSKSGDQTKVALEYEDFSKLASAALS